MDYALRLKEKSNVSYQNNVHYKFLTFLQSNLFKRLPKFWECNLRRCCTPFSYFFFILINSYLAQHINWTSVNISRFYNDLVCKWGHLQILLTICSMQLSTRKRCKTCTQNCNTTYFHILCVALHNSPLPPVHLPPNTLMYAHAHPHAVRVHDFARKSLWMMQRT